MSNGSDDLPFSARVYGIDIIFQGIPTAEASMKETLSRDVAFVRDETALLFVDLQRQFLIPGLEPAHPEMGADHYFYRRIREVVLPNAGRLMRAARVAG